MRPGYMRICSTRPSSYGIATALEEFAEQVVLFPGAQLPSFPLPARSSGEAVALVHIREGEHAPDVGTCCCTYVTEVAVRTRSWPSRMRRWINTRPSCSPNADRARCGLR